MGATKIKRIGDFLSMLGLQLLSDPEGQPLANMLYKANICKGWAHIKGTTVPASLGDSFNVSGLTDSGVGNYTITLDRDMANANYAIGESHSQGTSTFPMMATVDSYAVGSFRYVLQRDSGGASATEDVADAAVVVFGDQ